VANLNRDLEKGRAGVRSAMQNYHKKTEVAENALIAQEKAQQDPTITAKNISKLSAAFNKQKKEAEVADTAYQTQLSEFQSFQVKYEESMKEILKVRIQTVSLAPVLTFNRTLGRWRSAE
jgi:hypothetical protein